MEKFFLGTFLTDNKLDIINEQDINISVFIPEFNNCLLIFAADRCD